MKGYDIGSSDPKAFEEVLSMVRGVDGVVADVGNISYIFNGQRYTPDEDFNEAKLELARPQEELVKRLKKAGEPIILI